MSYNIHIQLGLLYYNSPRYVSIIFHYIQNVHVCILQLVFHNVPSILKWYIGYCSCLELKDYIYIVNQLYFYQLLLYIYFLLNQILCNPVIGTQGHILVKQYKKLKEKQMLENTEGAVGSNQNSVDFGYYFSVCCIIEVCQKHVVVDYMCILWTINHILLWNFLFWRILCTFVYIQCHGL